MLGRSLPWVALAIVAAVAVPVVAADPGSIDSGASASRTAVSATPLATDVVTIYNSGSLKDATRDAAFAAARDAGGTAVVGRSVSLGLRNVRRGANFVQVAPSGFAYPMGTTVLPRDLVARIMGRDVSGVLTDDTVVMSALTASLRGAQAGDVLEVDGANGITGTVTIGAIVDDSITGGTEILMSPGAADRLGITRLSRVVIWGFESRAAVDAAIAANGLISTSIRVRRSWDPFDPDFTLGMARTKQELGEFAYRVNSDGSVTIEQAWKDANIIKGSIFGLTLNSGCHSKVRFDLERAMAEVNAAGLADAINYGHANTAGGCYVPRFSRLSANSTIGFLSRHTWGMAVDTNTVGSCFGCAPPDFVTNGHCDVIRIFRKHGFAWGGNFLRPDGMHFEWVGEPRDQFAYPSRYCPNQPGSPRPPAERETMRDTMFADDGFDALLHG